MGVEDEAGEVDTIGGNSVSLGGDVFAIHDDHGAVPDALALELVGDFAIALSEVLIECDGGLGVGLVDDLAVVGGECGEICCIHAELVSSKVCLEGTPCEDVDDFLDVLELRGGSHNLRSNLSELIVREFGRIGVCVAVQKGLDVDGNVSLSVLAFEHCVFVSGLSKGLVVGVNVLHTGIHLLAEITELVNHGIDLGGRSEVTGLGVVDGSGEGCLCVSIEDIVSSGLEDGLGSIDGNNQLLLPVGSLRRHGDEVNTTEEVLTVGLCGGELEHVVASIIDGKFGL